MTLRFGERALCVDCGSRLPQPVRHPEAALAFALTALVFAVPALELPLVVVRKFSAEHVTYLWTGVSALWQAGMPLLSVWVALCGIAVPLVLLTTLLVLLGTARWNPDAAPPPFWTNLARGLQRWSMPEVQILAVLVAFVKIGVLVKVMPGAGLWFYGAMSVALLVAWRHVEPVEK